MTANEISQKHVLQRLDSLREEIKNQNFTIEMETELVERIDGLRSFFRHKFPSIALFEKSLTNQIELAKEMFPVHILMLQLENLQSEIEGIGARSHSLGEKLSEAIDERLVKKQLPTLSKIFVNEFGIVKDTVSVSQEDMEKYRPDIKHLKNAGLMRIASFDTDNGTKYTAILFPPYKKTLQSRIGWMGRLSAELSTGIITTWRTHLIAFLLGMLVNYISMLWFTN